MGRRVSRFSFGLEGCDFSGSVSDLERAEMDLSFAVLVGDCDKAEMARSRDTDDLSSSKLSMLSASS